MGPYDLIFIALILLVIFGLGGMPGRIAKSRCHPDTKTVQSLGYVGILIPILWPVALVWALVAKPAPMQRVCPFCDCGISERASVCPHCQKTMPECSAEPAKDVVAGIPTWKVAGIYKDGKKRLATLKASSKTVAYEKASKQALH